MKKEPFGRPPLPDEQIIDLFFSRDESAIKETDKKFGRILYGIAYNVLHDKQDCEECVNDAYLSAWKAIPPARPRSLCAFLSVIIRRISINRYYAERAKKKIPSEMTVSMEECSDFLSGFDSLEDTVSAKELGSMIGDFVNSLSEKQRYVFMGRFWFFDPVKDIAKELDTSESSVYKEISKIKAELKDYLETRGISI